MSQSVKRMRLEVHRIREDNRYGRIRLSYRRMSRRPVSTSRSTSASGDAITPGATDLKFPTLLGDMPAPNLLAYPTDLLELNRATRDKLALHLKVL